MKIQKAYRYTLDPTPAQAKQIEGTIDACRWVGNKIHEILLAKNKSGELDRRRKEIDATYPKGSDEYKIAMDAIFQTFAHLTQYEMTYGWSDFTTPQWKHLYDCYLNYCRAIYFKQQKLKLAYKKDEYKSQWKIEKEKIYNESFASVIQDRHGGFVTVWKEADIKINQGFPEESSLKSYATNALEFREKNVKDAWRNFYRPAGDPKKRGMPKFRSRYDNHTHRYGSKATVAANDIRIEEREGNFYLIVPRMDKLGAVKILIHNNSRINGGQPHLPEGTIKRMYIHREYGKRPAKTRRQIRRDHRWVVSLQTEREADAPSHRGDPIVGIDVNLANFCAIDKDLPISDEFVEERRDGGIVIKSFAKQPEYQRVERLRRRLQRHNARIRYIDPSDKKEGKRLISNGGSWIRTKSDDGEDRFELSNRAKRRETRIQKKYYRQKSIRDAFHQKLSTEIANTSGIVQMEDIKFGEIAKSARGTEKNPGRNVRQKGGLNRAWYAHGHGNFREILKQKMVARGGRLELVPAPYTSQTCSQCGHVNEYNRLTQSDFSCTSCGLDMHADIQAARNIAVAVPLTEAELENRKKRRQPKSKRNKLLAKEKFQPISGV